MTETQPSPLRLFITISIAILAVSTSSIFIRFAQAEAPSLVIAASRLLLASLFLAFPALSKHRGSAWIESVQD